MSLVNGFLAHTPFLVWFLLLLAALALETLYICDAAQPLRSKLMNIGNGCIVCVSIFLLTPLTSMLAYAATRSIGSGFIDLRLFPRADAVSQIMTALLFMFIYDVFFYFWHRAEHTIPALWDMHAVHHSETSINATTYIRQHWLEIPLQNLFIIIPILVLFKVTPVTMVAVAVGTTFHAFFAHMNIRLEMGRYSWILTGPQLHRLHHSRLPQHVNTNYAQVFPVIDRILGTYVPPGRNEFPPTGLTAGEPIDTFADVVLWPFKRWVYRIRHRIGQGRPRF